MKSQDKEGSPTSGYHGTFIVVSTHKKEKGDPLFFDFKTITLFKKLSETRHLFILGRGVSLPKIGLQKSRFTRG